MQASFRAEPSPARESLETYWNHPAVAGKGRSYGESRFKYTQETCEVTIAKLIYSAITSLDGYTADEEGNFDWAAPDQEVHSFVNDLDRSIGTNLYGRRMYETMVYWETAHTLPDQPAFINDFAQVWRLADKIVYSKELKVVSSARTRIERNFDPEAVRQMKSTAGRDICVGGPDLAAQAIKAGLVDEFHLLVAPIVVGGGRRSLPSNRPLGARTTARTPLRQRRGSPPIPHHDVT
jgi:dihydrofolate reductase